MRREKIDAAWIALHGTYGEDGCVQGLLECYGVPYTGSGVLASALAMDKVATRRIFDQESIESPRWRRYHGPADVARIGFPLVVKPSSEGSSVGVSIVKDQSQLQAALDAAQGAATASCCSRSTSRGARSTSASSTTRRSARSRSARRPSSTTTRPSTCATTRSTSCRRRSATRSGACCTTWRCARTRRSAAPGATRVDLILAEGGRAVCLEINTLPGMTDHSLLPKIAAHRGMDYATLVERMLDTAALHA